MIGKEVLNYTITSYIGKGGMGSVYLAENKYIKEQKVAIKVINGGMVNDFMRSQLAEEAKNLAKLNHPNIVHFINFDIDEEGNVYLIMDYADGISLENYIKTVSGLIVEEKICGFFEPILDAVQYAHNNNIIHRDIKPANIMITKEGKPVVLDFGIAKIINKQNESEADKLIMGTPSYMSPEQVKGEPLDQRSDIYSLGVMLHQMLTGNAPYDTTTMTEHEINNKVCNEPLQRMKTYYKYISDKVQKIVDKATAKDKKDRYQSCAEFKKALHDAIYPPVVPTGLKAAIIAVAALIIGTGAYYWDFTRTKVNYYKDYVEQWGVPVGIGKLKKDEVKHLNRMYRFVYSRGILQRVSHVNSKGFIIEDSESERVERPVDATFSYTVEKKVSKVKVKDKNGKVLYVKSYNEKLNTIIFQYDDEHGMEKTIANQTVGYINSLTSNAEDKGKISRWLVEYDDNGFVKKIEYAGFQNVKIGDAHGIYGRSYVRDEKGRTIEEHYLGIDGSPKATKWGLGIKKFYYDENDNWIKAEYQTVSGQPALDDSDGICIFTMDYDIYGNVIKAYHRAADGSLMIPKKNGISCACYEYDENGFQTELRYLGQDEKPVFANGVYMAKEECNENGFVVKRSFYDMDGNLAACNDGNAFNTCVVDEKGNVLEVWFYGVDGSLIDIKSGYSGLKLKYDTVGNIIERVFYNTYKNPCITSNRVAGELSEYNEYGLITKSTNLDTLLKPAKDKNGIAIVKYNYDKRGNLIRISFWDENDEKLSKSGEGVAGWNLIYDDNGNEIERNFFDESGKPCLVNKEYAKWTAKYDEHGNMTSIRYFGKDDKPIIVDGGIGVDYERDERGNILSNMPVDVNGKLASGRLLAKHKYDSFDNEIEFAVYDIDGKPAVNSHNYHKYTCKYDERNQITEIRYFGKDGKLVTYKNDKYAIRKDEYDNRGNQVKTSFFDIYEKPVCCEEGWASTSREFDNYSNVIHQVFFDVDGKPTDPKKMVPEGFAQYDKWGNIVYISAGDGNGNIILNKARGFAISRHSYDAKGNMLSAEYFDEKDAPMINEKEGCHKQLMTYNENGKQTSIAFFDNSNKPMINKEEEYHKKTTKYDDRGNETEIRYFGVNGEPILAYGIHKEVYTYDKMGNLTVMAYYDTKDRPANYLEFFHKIVITYDEFGNNKTKKVYSANGTILLDQFWDQKKNDWVSEDLSWQETVKDLDAELPEVVELGDEYGDMTVSSFRVTGNNSCKMIMNVNKSKYEISQEMIDYYKVFLDAFTEAIKKEVSQRVKVYSILYDSKGREIYQCVF